MSKPWQHVKTAHELAFWICWLDQLGDEEIRQIDWKECHRTREVEKSGLSALPRIEQARILAAYELNLSPRATLDRQAPGSFDLRHDAEDHIRLTEGRRYHVSELQCRTCMRILGYRRTFTDKYNVSMSSYHRWRRRLDDMKRIR